MPEQLHKEPGNFDDMRSDIDTIDTLLLHNIGRAAVYLEGIDGEQANPAYAHIFGSRLTEIGAEVSSKLTERFQLTNLVGKYKFRLEIERLEDRMLETGQSYGPEDVNVEVYAPDREKRVIERLKELGKEADLPLPSGFIETFWGLLMAESCRRQRISVYASTKRYFKMHGLSKAA